MAISSETETLQHIHSEINSFFGKALSKRHTTLNELVKQVNENLISYVDTTKLIRKARERRFGIYATRIQTPRNN